MEGFILLIVLYFVFQAIVKRTKQAVQGTAGKPDVSGANPAKTTQRTQTAQRSQTPQSRKKQTPPPPVRTSMSPVEQNQPYQTIRPMISLDDRLTGYTGSIGGTSQEGMASTEGMKSQEGGFSQEGETMLEYQLQMADTAMPAEYNADGSLPVLPAAWNANALVQAVVFREILDRPTQRWRA